MTDTNISMTAVYLVMGANDRPSVMQDLLNRHTGEQEVNERLAGFAPKVERVYQALKGSLDFGSWLFDVVQPFGGVLADCLLNGYRDSKIFYYLYARLFEACGKKFLTPSEIDKALAAWEGTPSPFLETYASAWISMAHVTPRTLDGLNALRDSELLPFWISETMYGYIVRFDALATYDIADDESNSIVKRLAVAGDLREICQLLQQNGLQAAHLDADGPEIKGLTTYEH